MRLFGNGIDVAGPFEAKTPVIARVRLDSGTPVRARLVCLADAARVASAFLEGNVVPEVEALASILVLKGETKSMQADADCSVALLTSALAEDGTSALAYMVQSAGAKSEPLVDCSRS